MTILLRLLAATAVVAATSSFRTCESYKIPITVTSDNLVYALPPFETDYDVADFIDIVSSRSAPPLTGVFSGTQKVTATYTIAGTFCAPKKGRRNSKTSTVLIATHGLNFDRRYWDPKPSPEKYSFVDHAVGQGYSVFFYDRLGTGQSSKVSGYVSQLSNQVAILQKIVSLIKSGEYVKDVGKPKSVVLVGHSFGSSVSLATVATDPTVADGVVLTGFSVNATYLNPIGFVLASQPRIASKQRPGSWRQLDTGYLTPTDLFATVNTFFRKPGYEISVAKYADQVKQPFSVTELFSAAALSGGPLSFTGPALIIAGEYDFIFCTSDCNGALDYPASLLFHQSRAFKTISYANAAHGLNLGLNAGGAFREITGFLSANGL